MLPVKKRNKAKNNSYYKRILLKKFKRHALMCSSLSMGFARLKQIQSTSAKTQELKVNKALAMAKCVVEIHQAISKVI